MFNEDYSDIKEGVFLLTRNTINVDSMFYKSYSNIERSMINTQCYNFVYEPDKYHLMFNFHIPQEYRREYEIFKNNKISEFSENYKQSIIKFHHLDESPQGKEIIDIMYRTEEGYKKREEELQVYIPRDIQISSMWNESSRTINRETYQQSMKIPALILP